MNLKETLGAEGLVVYLEVFASLFIFCSLCELIKQLLIYLLRMLKNYILHKKGIIYKGLV
jgi:hypothetical protein